MGTASSRHRLVPLKEGAAYWAVSEKTLRRRIEDGSISGYRVGPRLLRVDLNEIDAFLRKIPAAR